MIITDPFNYNPKPGEQEHIDLCDFAWRNLFINVDGTVQICCGTYNTLIRLEQPSDLDGLWNGEIFQKLRKGFFTKKNLPSFCKKCEWFKIMSNDTTIFKDFRKKEGDWKTNYNPLTVTLNITDKCNLRCNMCGKYGIPYDGLNNELSFKQIEAVIRKFGPTCEEINICSDGEFMLYSKINKILDLSKKISEKIGRKFLAGNTNGLLLGDSKIIEKVISEFRELRFSVDTLDKEKYKEIQGADIGKVKSIIKKCLKFRNKNHLECRIGVSAVIMKETLTDLENLFDFALKEGLDLFHCQHIMPVRRSDESRGVDTSLKYMKLYNKIYKRIKNKSEKNKKIIVFMPKPFDIDNRTMLSDIKDISGLNIRIDSKEKVKVLEKKAEFINGWNKWEYGFDNFPQRWMNKEEAILKTKDVGGMSFIAFSNFVDLSQELTIFVNGKKVRKINLFPKWCRYYLALPKTKKDIIIKFKLNKYKIHPPKYHPDGKKKVGIGIADIRFFATEPKYNTMY